MPQILEAAKAALSARMVRILSGLWKEWRELEKNRSASAMRLTVWRSRMRVASGFWTFRVSVFSSRRQWWHLWAMARLLAKRREFAAWSASFLSNTRLGGKPRLLGTSKRGNNYLRKL